MSWNYRLTKETITNKYLAEPEILFGIREVFYDENGDISGFSEEPDIISDSIDGMKDILTKMLESCNKPVIDYNTGEEVN
jgi:hypothetical protein